MQNDLNLKNLFYSTENMSALIAPKKLVLTRLVKGKQVEISIDRPAFDGSMSTLLDLLTLIWGYTRDAYHLIYADRELVDEVPKWSDPVIYICVVVCVDGKYIDAWYLAKLEWLYA